MESRAAPAVAEPSAQTVEAPEISVVVPVYDEEGSVLELAERVAAVLDAEGRSFELLFVDDGSRDATSQRVREARERDARVRLIRFRRNFGKAAALCAGFEAARGGVLITMDGDLQDEPREIPRFLAALEDEGLDLVSGWKKRRRDPISKRWPSKLFNWATRRLAQVDLHDFNCGFKAYRREVCPARSLYGELHRYIPVLASRKGCIPASWRSGTTARHGRSVRLGSLLQGPARPDHGPLHHQYTAGRSTCSGLRGLLCAGSGFLIDAWLALRRSCSTNRSPIGRCCCSASS
ncbi:MAG: glycosyltransferase family 2 protein [Thermoanaerobaculia bacterium]